MVRLCAWCVCVRGRASARACVRVLRLCSGNLAGRLMGPREMRDMLTMKKSNTHHASVQNWTVTVTYSQAVKRGLTLSNLITARICAAEPL